MQQQEKSDTSNTHHTWSDACHWHMHLAYASDACMAMENATADFQFLSLTFKLQIFPVSTMNYPSTDLCQRPTLPSEEHLPKISGI
jgi:hypothetical protein